MAIALETLKREKAIDSALVLDIDLHFGDGTVNILRMRRWATVVNIEAGSRVQILQQVQAALKGCRVDLIGISAGFDNHRDDWGGLLHTDDYKQIGRRVGEAAARIGAGCFAILEGGYNHDVLGQNVLALLQGMSGT
jgi:acetoin utilization deacetylase AcuC-like enzyme